jgi:arylsulfatase A-like enzyme
VQVDWTVGQVVKAIDESGIKNDTVIFYSSDNGSFMRRREDATAEDHLSDETIQAYRSDHHTANHVFRGTKADIWEAGHRVPFFARWPGRIKAGSQCAETICLTDLFATAAELAGVPLAEGVGQDSFSIVQLLDGKSWQKPRPPVIHHSAAGMFAIRDGKWKLVLGNGSGGRDKPAGKAFAKPYRLFDMEKDPSEGEDVAESNTDVVSVLERKCRIIREGRIP